ncbi:HipA domain-containing protein [Flavisolibacter sp. BT320]|nr:HipA domain-containing protein [Flavisolibacter longurius]
MIDPTTIQVCPGTLAKGYTTYSPRCIRETFGGKKISHILPFSSPQKEGEQKRLFLESRSRISISGVQEKYSLRYDSDSKQLALTDKGGEYILKPVPVDLLHTAQVPANEHLTMQIAAQVYKMPTARCALIFFNDGVPAYITRRFDVKADGTRCLKEDFASIAGLTSMNGGRDFKYTYSYEGIAGLIDKYIPANIPTKEAFFRLVVFNYLFSNGDAHLKNFSRIDCQGEGDAFLAPAYDLINTRIHIDDGDMGLSDGLYENDHEHPSFATYGHYCFDDFYEFGKRIGLVPVRIKRLLLKFLDETEAVQDKVENSFLDPEMKAQYMRHYQDKHKRLSTSLQEFT